MKEQSADVISILNAKKIRSIIDAEYVDMDVHNELEYEEIQRILQARTNPEILEAIGG